MSTFLGGVDTKSLRNQIKSSSSSNSNSNTNSSFSKIENKIEKLFGTKGTTEVESVDFSDANKNDANNKFKSNNDTANRGERMPEEPGKLANLAGKIKDALFSEPKKIEHTTLRVEDIDFTKYATEYTAEDLEALKGTMSSKDYEDYIKGYKEFKKEEAKYYENLLNGKEGQEGQEALLGRIDTYILMTNRGDYPKGKSDEQVEKEFGGLGIHSYEQLQEYEGKLSETVGVLKAGIESAENMEKSASYDNLEFIEGYNDYEIKDPTDADKANLETDADAYELNTKEMQTINNKYSGGGKVYSYELYHKKHPNITPETFVKMVKEKEGDNTFYIRGLGEDYEVLSNLVEISETNPELEKKYRYLYDQDPEKAKEFLKDCEYEINNAKGKMEAEEFYNSLDKRDGEKDISGAILNELKVSGRGLTDGLQGVEDGLGYVVEALLTAGGLKEENRTRSVNEYKQMYLLQELGEGKYSGKLLTNNYEISQGIGNMLPSIAVSTFCPPAGTALMGISAGGNAYHGEMVAGHSLAESIVYGSFSGASEALLERYIGGLPGVSNVEAKGFKGLLQAAHMEGREEVIQTLFDKLFLRTTILKEESPKSMDEWIDFAKDIGKSYVYGAITAGILQSPGAAIRAYNNSSNTSSSESLNIPNDVKESSKQYTKIFKEDIKGKATVYSEQLLNTALSLKYALSNKKGFIRFGKINSNKNVSQNTPKTVSQNSYTVDPQHGYQLSIDNMGEFFKNGLKNGFFTEEQINNILSDINSKGYMSESLGVKLSKMLSDSNYDVYVKTVHSSDVPSIFKTGIHLNGNATSGFGMRPQTIADIKLENSVTQQYDMGGITEVLKNAIGISQGGNPINGTIILKVPKGLSLADMVYHDGTGYSIKPEFIDGFVGCDENGRLTELQTRNASQQAVNNPESIKPDNTNSYYGQIDQVIDLMSQRHPDISNFGRDQLAAYLLTGNDTYISKDYQSIVQSIPKSVIWSYYQENGLDFVLENVQKRIPVSNNVPTVNTVIDQSMATIIDVSTLNTTSSTITTTKGNINLNKSYEGYDYVVKPTTSLQEILSKIKNVKDQKVLIELTSIEELNSDLLKDIPDNISFRISNYTSNYAQTDSFLYTLDHLTYNAQELQAITTKLNEIKSGIDENWDDYQKAEYVYNYLRDNIEYNENPGGSTVRAKEYDGLASLIVGKSTCQGFAHTYRMILNSLNIECEEVWGKLDSTQHAFNVVKIGDDIFIVDTVRELLNNQTGTGFGVALETIKNHYTVRINNNLANHVNSEGKTPKILDNSNSEQLISDARILQFEQEFNLDYKNESQRRVIDSIIKAENNIDNIDNSDIKYLIKELAKILKENDITITTYDFNAAGNKQLNVSGISEAEVFMNFFHEAGHIVHHFTDGLIVNGKTGINELVDLTEEQLNVLKNAHENYEITDERRKILSESIQRKNNEIQPEAVKNYLALRETEEAKMIKLVDENYDNNPEVLEKLVKKYANYFHVKNKLNSINVSNNDIATIMADKSLVEMVLKTGNNTDAYNREFGRLTSDYEQYGLDRKISSMLNSLLMSNKEIDLGNGEIYTFINSHTDKYFKEHGGEQSSFGELMADYFSIHANGNQELINTIKTILGDDVVKILDDKYAEIAEAIVNAQNIAKNNTQTGHDIETDYESVDEPLLIKKAEEKTNEVKNSINSIKDINNIQIYTLEEVQDMLVNNRQAFKKIDEESDGCFYDFIIGYIKGKPVDHGSCLMMNGMARGDLFEIDEKTNLVTKIFFRRSGTNEVFEMTPKEFKKKYGRSIQTVKEEQEIVYKRFNDFMNSIELGVKLTLYRGINWNALEQYGLNKNSTLEEKRAKLIGKVYEPKGLLSCCPALDEDSLPQILTGKPIRIIINVDETTHGVDLTKTNSTEKEILLANGNRFDITDVTEDDKYTYIFMNVIN